MVTPIIFIVSSVTPRFLQSGLSLCQASIIKPVGVGGFINVSGGKNVGVFVSVNTIVEVGVDVFVEVRVIKYGVSLAGIREGMVGKLVDAITPSDGGGATSRQSRKGEISADNIKAKNSGLVPLLGLPVYFPIYAPSKDDLTNLGDNPSKAA